jgi:predicted nuclease of predicted toxin-antitoxin system
MRFWVDAQLPPKLATWRAIEFSVQAESLRDLGLRDATDAEIFKKAGDAGVVVTYPLDKGGRPQGGGINRSPA